MSPNFRPWPKIEGHFYKRCLDPLPQIFPEKWDTPSLGSAPFTDGPPPLRPNQNSASNFWVSQISEGLNTPTHSQGSPLLTLFSVGKILWNLPVEIMVIKTIHMIYLVTHLTISSIFFNLFYQLF